MSQKPRVIVSRRRPAPGLGRVNHQKRTRLRMPQTAQVRRGIAAPIADALPTASPDPAAPGPPLKWAGGKRWQVPHLRPLWDAHRDRRLVEPFCGGLAVALSLTPVRALFYYLNRTGYNGLCRFNQQGKFNVPFGRYKRIDYRKDFTGYVPAFAQFE